MGMAMGGYEGNKTTERRKEGQGRTRGKVANHNENDLLASRDYIRAWLWCYGSIMRRHVVSSKKKLLWLHRMNRKRKEEEKGGIRYKTGCWICGHFDQKTYLYYQGEEEKRKEAKRTAMILFPLYTVFLLCSYICPASFHVCSLWKVSIIFILNQALVLGMGT